MLSIDECWVFLESHIGNRVSELPVGATSEEIRQAEKAMKVKLPADYQQFLKRHNGSGHFSVSPYKLGGGDQR